MRTLINPDLSFGTLLVVALALHVGCGQREPAPAPPAPTGPVSLAESHIREVVPTADGGAYMQGRYPGGLWYVRAGKAVRVNFQEAGQTSGEEGFFVGLEITPTVDGGAYATGFDKGIWYLQEASAVRVSEAVKIASATQQNSSRQDKYFSLYISELKRRRSAEQSEEFEEFNSNESEEGEY